MIEISSTCAQCGKQNAARMRFCVACGARLAIAASTEVQASDTRLASRAPQGPTPELAAASGTTAAAAEVLEAPAGAEREAPPVQPKADPWIWVATGGAFLYLALVVLVFFAPQAPFCAGTVLLLPPAFYLILLRGHATGWIDRSTSGCMVIVASFVGGLVLYGLLLVFQRDFFLAAFQALMDSGS